MSKRTDSIVTVKTQAIENQLQKTRESQNQILAENDFLKKSNEQVQKTNDRINDNFYSMWNSFIDFKQDLVNSKNDLDTQVKGVKSFNEVMSKMKGEVDEIKKLDFVNQSYLVGPNEFIPDNPKDSLGAGASTQTIYFKNLITVSKNTLPIFKSPPSVILSPYSGLSITVGKVTKDYIKIKCGYAGITYGDEESNKVFYDLLIIYRDRE